MTRDLQPEKLDALPPDAPAARRARRDLRLINMFMGNPRILARALSGCLPAGKVLHLAEPGASDGLNSLATARRLPKTLSPGTWLMLDPAVCVEPGTLASFERLGWRVETVRADANEWLARQPAGSWDAIVSNLLLHHWPDAGMAPLLGECARVSRAIVAVEPRRSRLALLGARALFLIGADAITRHDAVLSVRAGFAGKELTAYWRTPGWQVKESRASWASHLFCARRQE